ncbi:MAG: family 16 glycosylhydrolase [Chitinophagaceae bacterium]
MKRVEILILFLFVMGCGKGKDGPGAEVTPKMTFDDVSVLEGTGASGSVEVKLTLDRATSKQVTVTYSTIDGTAKGGSDFTAVTNQTVTFAANEVEKKIVVAVVADDLKEGDEVFQVRVENPVNVVLLKGSSAVTLRNDDTKVGFNNTGYEAATSYPGYTLAWSDEFNGTSLDGGLWSNESGDGCPGLCGWGNNELQYYTAPPNNLFYQDGKMIIEAKAEAFGGKSYTSSRIKTQGKKAFQFGRIDIRAILPKGKGIWPAFWLLPQDNVFGGWPRSGEIDMMEYMGSETTKVLGTLHFGPGPNSTMISRNYLLPGGNFNEQFHVFSLEWKQDQIKWYVDDVLYSTVNKADFGGTNYPFNEKFFFIINLAVGGNFPGAPDVNTVFPQFLIMDYIRVYQN